MSKFMFVVVAGCALGGLVACGGSSGGGGPEAPTVNVTGRWSTAETVDASACGEGVYVEDDTYAALQNGAVLQVEPSSSGLTFVGLVSGNTLVWSGSYPDSGGTTTITSLAMTVDVSQTGFSGTANWTWSDGVRSCTGSTFVVGTRSTPIMSQLTLGVELAGTISSSGQEDWYYFIAPSEQSVTITLTGGDGSTADLDLFIYDDNLVQVDASTSSTSNESSTGTLAAGELIFMKVDPFSFSSATPYTISVSSP